MKLVKFGLVTVMLISGLFVFGCGGSEPSECGKFTDGTYTNNFFKLEIDVPVSWYVMDDVAKKVLVLDFADEYMDDIGNAIMGAGSATDATVAAAKKEFSANMDKLLNNYLLNASKYMPEDTTEFNPNLVIGAMELAECRQHMSGQDLLSAFKGLAESVKAPMTFPEGIYTELLGGEVFYVLEAIIDDDGSQINYRRYSTVLNGYELRIEINYNDQDSMEELEFILATMRLRA